MVWTFSTSGRRKRRREECAPVRARLGAYTVKDAVTDYLRFIDNKPSSRDASLRLDAFALPAFGDVAVNELSAEALREWHSDLAKTPARCRTKLGAKQALP